MRMPTVLSLRGGGKKTLGPGGVLSWIKRLQISGNGVELASRAVLATASLTKAG